MQDRRKTRARLIEELEELRRQLAERAAGAEEGVGELAEKERLLRAFHRISQTALSSLDLERILDELAEQVLDAGIFRSLMIALMEEEQHRVRVVRNLVRWSKKEGWLSEPRITKNSIGLTYDLDEENITPLVARTGQMQVIEEWSERFDRRVDGPELREGQVAYFLPVRHGERVLAVLATGSTLAEKEETLRRIELMQPLLDQVAVALERARLYAQVQKNNEALRREIAERHRAEEALLRQQRLERAEQAVRLKIASMDAPEDLCLAMEEISRQLQALGVEHDSCSIQVVNAEGTDFVSVGLHLPTDIGWHKVMENFAGEPWGETIYNGREYPWVIEVWKTGKARYDPCTREKINDSAGRSLIDVAFSQGTLAINNQRAGAFGQAEVEILQRFAKVLSEGFQRFKDIVRRQRAEREVQHNEERLQALVGSLDEIVFEFDGAGTILNAWTTNEKLLARPRAEILGRRVAEILGEEFTRPFVEVFQRVLATGQSESVEYPLQVMQGKRWFQGRISPVPAAEGLPRTVCMLTRDITGQKRRQLRETALHRVREEVWKIQEEGDIGKVLVLMSQGLRQQDIDFAACGVNRVDTSVDPPAVLSHNLSGQGKWEVVGVGRDRELVLRLWREGKVAYRRDLEAQDLYGEREHLYRAFAGPVRSVLDLPFAHGTLAFNSSEPDAFSEEDIEVLQEFALVLEEGFRRMDDLQKLRQSEERYRTLVQHLPQAIVLMQGNELFFANQALGKITGHSMEELKAMSPQERRQIVHPDDLERVLARYQEPDARKGVPVHMEYRLIGKDGSVHWVESSSQLVQFRDRPVWQILIADIAERKQMEQQLIRLERLEALGEMAGGVNHHLNNILTGVLAPAQLLRQRVEDPEMLVEIDEIVSAARRAADLVRRLGKSAPGGYREAPEVVELNEVARRALEKRPASPNIELIEKWGAVSPVKAQRAALLEGVGQLLVNAAEAMPRGGTITVRTWEDHRGVYLSVADTGKGMDESVRRRVFEPFFSTKGTVDSGLSLSALRSVVASWGGEMEVESAPGKGAVFTVRLPAWKAATPPAEERAGEAPIRILLVEDEEIVRRPVERFLAPTCRVAVAENGRQALEKFKPGEFEVALIDLGLPDLGGDRVALQLQSQDPAMARVLMTGWMLEESDERARAFDFQLAKPFRRMEDLLDMVREATALCRKRRAGT